MSLPKPQCSFDSAVFGELPRRFTPCCFCYQIIIVAAVVLIGQFKAL